MLIGENGILNKSQKAKNNTEYAKEKEEISLAISTSKIENIDDTTGINEENFEEILKKQYNKNVSIDRNEDKSFCVTFNESNRTYYVSEQGDIIDSSNVFKISTSDELINFRDNVNNGNNYDGMYIYLSNDITLDINEKWIPIGIYVAVNSEQNKPFKGTFDGKNHQINGININTTGKCQGLFSLVEKGTVKNLILGKDNNISGGLVTAGIVAYAYNEAQILNCHNECNIISNGKTVGGIVGVANKNVKIEKSSNSGKILRKRR